MNCAIKFLPLMAILLTIAPTVLCDQADDYNTSGTAKLDKRDWDGAIADFTNAIKLKPDFAEAYNKRGRAEEGKGLISFVVRGDESDLNAAIVDFTNAIRLKPEYAEAYRNRGGAKNIKKDFEGAIQDFTSAIQLQPDFRGSYFGRGQAKMGTHDLEGAIADFTTIIQLNPDNAYAYHSRGEAKQAKGDMIGANADYAKALQIDPDYVENHTPHPPSSTARKNLQSPLFPPATLVMNEKPQLTPEEKDWNAAVEPFSPAKVEVFVQRYPNGSHSIVANQIIEDEHTIGQIVASGPGSRFVVPSASVPPFISKSIGVNTERGRTIIETPSPGVNSARTVFGKTMMGSFPRTISSSADLNHVTLRGPFLPCGELSVFLIRGAVENIYGDPSDPIRLLYSKQYGVIYIGGWVKVPRYTIGQ